MTCCAYNVHKARLQSLNCFALWMSATYCDEYGCLFICLSARITRELHSRTICYISLLPVLWMTSLFHRMALWRVIDIHKQRQNSTRITAEILNKFCSTVNTGSSYSLLSTVALFNVLYQWDRFLHKFFVMSPCAVTRGHKYKLYKHHSNACVRSTFFLSVF